MAKIKIIPEDFFNFTLVFLYDIMINDEATILNEHQINFIKKLKKLGMKSLFMKEFIEMKSENRLNYKRLKELFYTLNASEGTIKIISKGQITENIDSSIPNFYDIKDSLKRCITLMKKAKYNNPNRVVTDTMLDKIITKVLKEKRGD